MQIMFKHVKKNTQASMFMRHFDAPDRLLFGSMHRYRSMDCYITKNYVVSFLFCKVELGAVGVCVCVCRLQATHLVFYINPALDYVVRVHWW